MYYLLRDKPPSTTIHLNHLSKTPSTTPIWTTTATPIDPFEPPPSTTDLNHGSWISVSKFSKNVFWSFTNISFQLQNYNMWTKQTNYNSFSRFYSNVCQQNRWSKLLILNFHSNSFRFELCVRVKLMWQYVLWLYLVLLLMAL